MINLDGMDWYQWIALISLGICLLCSLFHIFRLIRLGKPREYAPVAGNVGGAIRYSFTGAMNPMKKESAFLHLPTYTAGIVYHLGSFLSILLFLTSWTSFSFPETIAWIIASFLLVSFACGTGILIKRIVKKDLRALSSPDDYLSNLLVTIYQGITALQVVTQFSSPVYYLVASLLLLYFPLGKLKHAYYFFSARYHLGLFYGRRGVWQSKTADKGAFDE
jgi:hypothetical protein